MGWESFVEVLDVKTTYRKSCSPNLLLVSVLTLDPSFKDIFPAMKSCLANILVQFVQLGWLL